MKALSLLGVPLLAALLLSPEGLYFVSVTSHGDRSAHPSKPIQFQYVCPMHEDVKSNRPGKCPKCKMKLEKKRITQPVE